MNRFVLGVIGHVDHGKTALVRALTGADTDRLPEEKERGISIALGFAHLEVDDQTDIDLIDMPGHERFVRTMISGATGINAVLLVVAANEGVKPQTIEHINIAALLGITRAVVAISKSDLVSAYEALAVGENVTALLETRGLQPMQPVITSAIDGSGLAELRATLKSLAATQQPHSTDGIPYLPIDRAFTMTGHGPVVTGTLRGATVSIGDVMELLPSGKSVRVRTIQEHKERVTQTAPGRRVALNLRNVEIGDLKRGMAISAPGSVTPSEWLTIAIQSVEGAPTMKNGMALTALLGTNEFAVRLRLLDRELLEAGEISFAQLRCSTPVAVPAGEHVILRLMSPPWTVAGGRILEPVAQRHRRNTPALLARLRDLRDLPLPALLAAEIDRRGARGTTISHLSRLTAGAPWRVSELLHTLSVVVTRSGTVMRSADLAKLEMTICSQLAAQRQGLAHEELRAQLPKTAPLVIEEALNRLMARKAIQKRGKQFCVPRAADDKAAVDKEAQFVTRIAESIRNAGLTVPTPKEILIDAASRRAVDRLLRDGTLIRTVDPAKSKEIIFHKDAIANAREKLAPLLESDDGLLVTDIAAALGTTRKYVMPLLDHLDRTGFTRRSGDRRFRGNGHSSPR